MKNLIALIIVFLSVTAQATPHPKTILKAIETVSIQEQCSSCKTKVSLYDGIVDVFYQGKPITMKEFRFTAFLIGQLVGVSYNKSGENNIKILHALGERRRYHQVEIEEEEEELGLKACVVDKVDFIPVFEQEKEIEIETIKVDSIPNSIDVPTTKVHQYQDSVSLAYLWGGYLFGDNRAAKSISHRKARHAMKMAAKYGGYDTKISYSDGWGRQRYQHCKLVQDKGEEILFLGWGAGQYKDYYKFKKKRKNKVVYKNQLFKAGRGVTVAKSRRACKKNKI